MKEAEFHQHVRILSWLNIGIGGFFAALGAFFFIFLTGIGLATGEAEGARIFGCFGIGAAVFISGFFGVPGILAGMGILNRQPWGRILGLVVAAFGLLNFPVGTALGIYGLWVLTDQHATAYFERSAGTDTTDGSTGA